MGSSSSKEKSEPNSPETESIPPDYGFIFFPKRAAKMGLSDRTAKLFPDSKYETFLRVFTVGESKQQVQEHKKCIQHVVQCVDEDPFIKLMIAALHSKGCGVDVARHISCEPCKGGVSSGFDCIHCQIAICQNTATTTSQVCSALRQRLVHAFDFCRGDVDLLNNPEHIACSHIRAINLSQTSFARAVDRDVTSVQLFGRHKNFVRQSAVENLLMVRNISLEEAEKVVDRVFERCFNDLEPVGRIPKPWTFEEDSLAAFREARYFGYRPRAQERQHFYRDVDETSS